MTAGKREPDVEGLAAGLGSYSINDKADGVKREDTHEDERGETSKLEDKETGGIERASSSDHDADDKVTRHNVKDEDRAPVSEKKPVLHDVKKEDDTATERSIKNSKSKEGAAVNTKANEDPAIDKKEPPSTPTKSTKGSSSSSRKHDHSQGSFPSPPSSRPNSPDNRADANLDDAETPPSPQAPAPERVPNFVVHAVQNQKRFQTPRRAANCRRCKTQGERHVIQPSNPNGNAGRPYYKCPVCDKFITFADNIGNCVTNPECKCKKPCRLVLIGIEESERSCSPGKRGLFFRCHFDGCDYSETAGEIAERFVNEMRDFKVA